MSKCKTTQNVIEATKGFQFEWNEVAVFEIVAVIRMESSTFDIHSFDDGRA